MRFSRDGGTFRKGTDYIDRQMHEVSIDIK